jgi:hypothetical protein
LNPIHRALSSNLQTTMIMPGDFRQKQRSAASLEEEGKQL